MTKAETGVICFEDEEKPTSQGMLDFGKSTKMILL
jgi:hypothetical protein